MYDKFEIVIALLVVALGVFMAAAPKKALRKDMRDDENAIARARRNGIIITIAGIVLVVMLLVLR